MQKTEKQSFISFAFVLIILLILVGCTPVGTACSHDYSALHDAAAAGFLHDGNIAYYQCSNCDQLFDAQKSEVDTVVIPKLSSDLSLCINGTPIPLLLIAQDTDHIAWSLEKLSMASGDVVTICDTSNPEVVYAYCADGIVGDDGKIKASVSAAAVSLVATADGLTLSIIDNKYPGIVAKINGEQYPLHAVNYGEPGISSYVYGYVELKPGDQFVIIDNVKEITYDHDDLAQDCAWNIYDYHRGENGEFVIDYEARYKLEFSKDGNEKVYITKAFAPSDGNVYHVVFDGEVPEKAAMKEVVIAENSETFEDFIWFATDENTMSGSDIAEYIAQKGLYAHSAVLFLKEGMRFYIENTAASVRITGDHLTDVSGTSDCFKRTDGFIEITQNGTYHIRYLPSCDSICLEQLSTGGFTDVATEFDKEILAIPSNLEIYYTDAIKALYEAYLYLPDPITRLLKASAKLKTLYHNVLEIEKASPQVTYYLNTASTNHVYTSKEALFHAFFTDFYYYIVAYYGTDHLIKYNVRNARDFVNLAKDFNGAGATNLCGIGYAAGKYMLESRNNNILQNQTDNGFWGFCYQNGLYQDVLPFFIRFFAYWRIDEGFANRSNHGADTFAEAWATTVDIAKLFYYDENTSYVKTERVIDCFENMASVVYGFDGSGLPADIKLRGYTFEGWYDNPAFSGAPVTNLDLTQETIKLYAKWSIDEHQQDKEQAELVDIYTYNLTTRQALITKATVGYVKEMYDNLSANAKQLVKEYDTLLRFIGIFS